MTSLYIKAHHQLAIECRLQEYFASVLREVSSALNVLLVALVLAHAISLTDAPVQLIGTVHD